VAAYTDHIDFHEFNFKREINDFQFRQLFNYADVVLVNGNHFKARSQVVVIDETKKASLQKRLSQLTNIELILLSDNVDDVFDFIRDFSTSESIPVFQLKDTSKIIGFFKTKMEKSIPLLSGLVLAGGKSKRMGFDKGSIQWHAKEQQYYVADILQEVCETVFISCREDQQNDVNKNYRTLTDTFTGLGPFGAILSAFREQPDSAWLVVACDLPLLNIETLQLLKSGRNVSSMATAFESPFNNFPEPLITIWEPRSYPVLLSFLSQGYNCPGKALRNMEVTVLKPGDPDALTNVNTPQDFDKAREILKKNLQAHHAK
jgi:molybdenum cofactor guanylyltransferase